MSRKRKSHPKSVTFALGEMKKTGRFSPSEYMRARRPELFSDSKKVAEHPLSRAVFEHFLDSLTSRKEEAQFETFARKLAEREVCPNLKPQTGPTGGGDSKVDTQTYPVASELSALWYEGLQGAAQERWAFAISAKKKWRDKLKSDIQKIADTGRGYKVAYFISNQPIRDKDRASVEDELSKKHALRVEILDRTWLLEKVFSHNRIALAIESFNLTDLDKNLRVEVGPNDQERENELKKLDEEITDPNRYAGVKYQLAEDCLSSALLARGLERPRIEVDGRFDRAERIAAEVGDRLQQLRIKYLRAWTVLWWYEDYRELNRQYDEAEGLAEGSEQAEDYERLVNLFNLIVGAVAQGKISRADGKVGKRSEKLREHLGKLAADEARPNNALAAKADLLLLDLMKAIYDRDEQAQSCVFDGFQDVLGKTQHLGHFAFQKFANLIREIGNFLPDNESYERLFEDVVTELARRKSEGEGGEALAERGFQKLSAGRHYDAIRLFGRAQQKLIAREYRSELIQALVGCSLGYEQAGLLWAARMNMLAAAVQALAPFQEDGEVHVAALRTSQKLVWLELQLGRIPSILTWLSLRDGLARHCRLEEKQSSEFMEERQSIDFILGMLFLSASLEDLRELEFLPSILEAHELFGARFALMFALGYEAELRRDGSIPAGESSEAVFEHFRMWSVQPAKSDLPSRPNLMYGAEIELHSNVLGCEITGVAKNNTASIALLESLLGVIEAFLATSLESDVFPYQPSIRFEVEPSRTAQAVSFKIDDSTGEPVIKITHPANFDPKLPQERKSFQESLLEIAAHGMSRVINFRDAEEHLNRIGREGAYARALSFSDINTAIGIILGNQPKLSLQDWRTESTGKTFPVKRQEKWDHGFALSEKKPKPGKFKLGKGSPPKDLLDIERGKHSDQKIASIIKLPLWDRARWRGNAYLYDPQEKVPFFGLLFEDKDAALKIFSDWKKRFGSNDTEEQIRISILTDIDRKNPLHYRTIIGSNLESMAEYEKEGKRIAVAFRIQTVEPTTRINLDNFLEQLKEHGSYMLVPVHASTQKVGFDLAIQKREIHVRPAWQVTENDPDGVGVLDNDELIIPDSEKDPPVRKLMEWRKAIKRKHGAGE